MNGKKSKIIRKLAKRLAQENQTYLTKTSIKVFTDLQGNKTQYTTDQTVLHPMSFKSTVSLLKKFTREGYNVNKLAAEGGIEALVSIFSTGKLSQLAVDGYK